MRWFESLLGRARRTPAAGMDPVPDAASTLPSIQMTGVRFAYGARHVLDGVDLQVAPGEVVGLIGPNGSGKSTLIKLLSGVMAGYQGRIRLAGRDLAARSRRDTARILAVVPQEPIFGFPFTALEIVLLGRHPHLGRLVFESARDIELAREALSRCDALHLAERNIQELSSGERQRVVVARALAQEPRVLLLDEPGSFLDIRHQVALYEMVRALAADRGMSVLLVIHDLNLAAEYCDRAYLLHRGRVHASGPIAEVMTYANLTHVFETDIYVDSNDLTGKLVVVPLSSRAKAALGEARPTSPGRAADPIR